MRTPSEKLVELLDRLKLCSAADLMSCERQVRNLCHDLPDFDTVWLDALIQRDLLTPWQAEILQSGRPERLLAGRYHLRSSLGRSTYFGTPVVGGSAVALKISTGSDSQCGELLRQRLTEVTREAGKTKSGLPSSLVLPSEVVTTSLPNETAVVSTFFVGWTMEELLIRGGRLPWQAVAEIGRDLLAAGAWLESVCLLHGDVVLRNVLLTPSGRTMLTDPFVRRTLQPSVSMSEHLTLRDCEGVAPEQIGSGRPADARSELYSLGCLLWQLLTSRPPVLTADPVTRLMKMKEHDIADVRVHVPDCPEWIARLLTSMTRRAPELRPQHVEDVWKQWRSHSGHSYAHSLTLARSMPEIRRYRSAQRPYSRRPGKRRHARRFPKPAMAGVAALLLLLTVAVGNYFELLPKTLTMRGPSKWMALQTSRVGSESGLLPSNAELAESLLRESNADTKIASALNVSVKKASQQNRSPQGPQVFPLPQQDAEGRITLSPGMRYLAATLASDHRLEIRTSLPPGSSAPPDSLSADNEPDSDGYPEVTDWSRVPMATVEIPAGSSWEVAAPEVRFSNIAVVYGTPTDSAEDQPQSQPDSPQPATVELIRLQAMKTELTHCSLNSGTDQRTTCMVWSAPSGPKELTTSPSTDENPATVRLTNCVLTGSGTGIRFRTAPPETFVHNVLFATKSTGIRCDFAQPGDQVWSLNIHRLTQRFSQSLADIVVQHPEVNSVQLRISGGESVIVPRLSVLRVTAIEGWDRTQLFTSFLLPETGNGVIVPPEIPPVVFFDPRLKHYEELPDEQTTAESLLIADTEFSDANATNQQKSEHHPEFSQLVNFEGPKLTAEMPGIIPAQLPGSLHSSRKMPSAAGEQNAPHR